MSVISLRSALSGKSEVIVVTQHLFPRTKLKHFKLNFSLTNVV